MMVNPDGYTKTLNNDNYSKEFFLL